jgi:hypothetical protein
VKLPLLYVLLLCSVGCAKKEQKPQRTEPWLAHPPASASSSPSGEAALPPIRYVLNERSVIRFELPTRRGALSGSIARVTGELHVDLTDLSRTRGLVRADLSSLRIHAPAAAERNRPERSRPERSRPERSEPERSEPERSDPELMARARAALELARDTNAPATFASFDLTAVEDPSPAQIVPASSPEGANPASRNVRFTAVGNLLLHGFRVARRAPLAAEFGFTSDPQVPSSVLIRSRSPFVISLETHAIVALGSESAAKGSAPVQAREVRVSVELYGTKMN